MLGYLGEDYGGDYYDQYFYDTGSYDGGGVGDNGAYYSDYLNFDDLYGSGGYTPGIDYAPYEPMDLNPPDYYDSGSGSSDLYFDYLDYYLGQGYDYNTADELAYSDAQGGAIQLEGEGQLPTEQPAQLPDISNWWDFSYQPQSYLPSYQTPDYTPYEPPAPPPPPLPQSPATQQPGLPPACPGGQYHPYPIGHPNQNACVPFPGQQTTQPTKPQPQSGSGSSSGGSSSGGSKPPAPQSQNCANNQCKHPTTGQCISIPQGYYRDPQTQICRQIPAQQQPACVSGTYRASNGQCVPIPQCSTPGTVFDARSGRCVPFAQAQQPVCPSGYWANKTTGRCEPIPACPAGMVFDTNKGTCVLPSELSDAGLFADLSTVPWWIWLAAGLGAFLLFGKDSEGRTTTVRYRRST